MRHDLVRLLSRSALALAWLGCGIATTLRADIVHVIDPPGLGEIDEEIGNITENAFEALGPIVNDHENGTGPQASNQPFLVGDVSVTGRYGYLTGPPQTCANFSGGRSSFTPSCGSGTAGSWMYAEVFESNKNRVLLQFAPPAGEIVRAAGLAWVGRNNRTGDMRLTATATFADGSRLSDTIDIDGNGDGLPNGKDVFIGFEDPDGRGGIISLEAIAAPLLAGQPYVFHGWDDVGVVTEPAVMDSDDDGINDDEDNCPSDSNADQVDTDLDLAGDACDADDDGDGIADVVDNCGLTSNPDQVDTDGDFAGDACDTDDDEDGVADASDNCPFTANASQADQDGDLAGDACDADADGDGITAGDNCPLVPNAEQVDTDGDALGDDCDADDDGDGICDAGASVGGCSAGPDNCPILANADQADMDGDGVGDACDSDLDGDGVDNDDDLCPAVASPSNDDSDGDLLGDACDLDDDNDGVGDGSDNCPFVANASQSDADDDDLGDACDSDLDGDGVSNAADNCTLAPNADQADFDGDEAGDACDADIDGDGVANESDACGDSPAEAVVMASGCSLAQICPCEGPQGSTSAWRNHGKYVSCTAQAASGFVAAGLMTEAEKDAAVSGAAGSGCGR